MRIDPYSEVLYQRLIGLLAARGRRDNVRRLWREACIRLEEIELDPSKELEALVAKALKTSTRKVSLSWGSTIANSSEAQH